MQENLKILLNKYTIFRYLGLYFVILGCILILLSFFPIIKNEIKYIVQKSNKEAKIIINSDNTEESDKEKIIVADNPDFSIIIPKIGANSRVIANVDPFNEKEYQQKLSEGVAHADGSVFPGQIGTTFIFAHSSSNFYEAKRYNSIFYLSNKLINGDKFYIVYGGEIFEYVVSDISIVLAEDVGLISENHSSSVVKLMTCWPAGTTYRRLIVEGKLDE